MLTELFALPVGLRHVATISGQKLYGSDSLNEKFIEAAETAKSLVPIIDIIKAFVKNGKITPVFANKNLILHLINLLDTSDESEAHKSILGFYTPSEKKIFLFIDNNTNFLWFVNNDFVGILVIHELIHMVADLKSSKFLPEFKEDLFTFYKDLFVHIYGLTEKSKLDAQVIEIYTFFFKSMEMNGNLDYKKFKANMSKLSKYSMFEEKEFNKRVDHYFLVVKYFYTGRYDLLYSPAFRYILQEPYYVYKRKFKFFPSNKNCIQEFVIPSEVISTIVEYNVKSKHYNAIKALT